MIPKILRETERSRWVFLKSGVKMRRKRGIEETVGGIFGEVPELTKKKKIILRKLKIRL